VTVLNVAVVTDDRTDVEFYINEKVNQISTIVRQETGTGFRTIRVNAVRLSDLTCDFGVPLYVKLDIEGADDMVLSELFSV